MGDLGELLEFTVELDVDKGFVLVPVPFFVDNVVPSNKRLTTYVRGILKVKVYCTLLDLTNPLTYLEGRPKAMILNLCEYGEIPSRKYHWQCIRTAPGSKAFPLIYATII